MDSTNSRLAFIRNIESTKEGGGTLDVTAAPAAPTPTPERDQ